jgi:hypothetical protein
MNMIRSIFVYAFIIFGFISAAAAQTAADDLALFKKMIDAARTAPASRLTSIITDRDSGAVLETIVMERVPPDGLHFLSTRNGQLHSEMISDGKRTLQRKSPNEPWKALPVNLGKMMNKAPGQFSDEDIRKKHTHMKLIGDDQVNGAAARAYELTEDETGPSKVWLAADTSQILKMERDYEGAGPIAEPKFNGDLKSLQAQLKAATAQHHLHSVSTIVYDPSIKITMPPN